VASNGEPVPFSHKRHADLKIDCAYCHEKALSGERAGFPAAAKCMVCHAQAAKSSEAIARLAALKKDTPIVPEKPLYRLPDFVVFSHARHKRETISCDSCHGNVWATDAVELQLHMKMKACVDCHKNSHAVVACTVCHELSQ
jgi:Class III cytochrome C family/Cytochrome c7 and related cytochrome c